MSKSELSPVLLAALAVAATHIEPVTPIKREILQRDPHSKKTIRNRKRNKLAAQSRKRNRK